MQKITKYVKNDVWISEYDGKEFASEKDCKDYTKTQRVKNVVNSLQTLGFWENYNIPNIEFEGKVIENLKMNKILFDGERGFLLTAVGAKGLWVKVSIKNDKMSLLLFKSIERHNPAKWKFLGQVRLSDIDTTSKAYYYNITRNNRLLQKWERKNILIRSGLSKLTEEEKKALKLI